jgi:EpsI family protein
MPDTAAPLPPCAGTPRAESVNAEHDPIEPTRAAAAVAPGSGALRDRRGLVSVALLLAAAAFAYRHLLVFRPTDSIVVEMEGWFFEPSDTAPLVVVVLTLWLLYRRRERLAALPWRGGGVVESLALYAGALAVFSWARLTGATDLQTLSLILTCLATADLLGGRPALRVVALPVCFLLFAIPIPSPLRHQIVWKLQNWTAEATGLLLYWFDVPAVVSGERIELAGTVFAVIETCSGLRSVITLTMLCVLMIDLFRRGGWHAAILLLLTPLLAFATNAVRSVGLVLNPASSIATIHSLQGIAMLLVSVLVLYGIDGLLERLGVPNGSRPAVARPPGPPPAPSRGRLAFAVGFLAVLGVLAGAVAPWRIPSPRVPLPTDTIPRQLDGWRSADLQTDRLFLGMAALTGLVDRRYARDGESVDVFVGAGSPRQRLRSFYSPKTALPGSGWIVEEETRRERAGVAMDELVVRKGSERRLIHHWYLGTSGLLEELAHDSLALDESPLARKVRGVVVRISTPIDGGETREQAEARLDAMADRLREPLSQLMQPLGDEGE